MASPSSDSAILAIQALSRDCGSVVAMLERHGTVIKRARSSGDSDVYRLLLPDGRQVLAKSYAKRLWLIRILFARRCIQNEYEKLKLVHDNGYACVSTPYGILEKDTLFLEFLEGTRPLKRRNKHPEESHPDAVFYRQLQDMIGNLHAHQLCHGDIRRGNVLISKDMKPILIDFATACHFSGGLLSKLVTPFFMYIDNHNLSKILSDGCPELLNDMQRQDLHTPAWYMRLGNFYRHHIYRRFIKRRRNATPTMKKDG